jgi:hypothetical protein
MQEIDTTAAGAETQSATEVQAPTSQSWADDGAQGRCTAAHTISTSGGKVAIRCDGQAGHAGAAHQGRLDSRLVRWTST